MSHILETMLTKTTALRHQSGSTRRLGALAIESYPTRSAMGAASAEAIAAELRDRLARQAGVRMVFAAAPSQSEVLAALCAAPGIDWTRVTAFHMDEYIGLPPGAPERFAVWLDQHVFRQLPFAEVHRIVPEPDPAAAARAYAEALDAAPIDVVCLGFGVNGHIAFNDPPVADFHDPETVKVVTLDAASRHQQVHDGCFPQLDDVPIEALTLTIPALLSGNGLFCIVPGPTKRDAVRATLRGPISTACPASILRQHPSCTLYLDEASYPR
jgi:glucosamine-6-phosphate deaminase